MLFLFLLVGAAIVAVLVWRTLGAEQASSDRSVRSPESYSGTVSRPSPPPRASGPDDDPDFLRQLDEKVKGPDDDPPSA